MAFFSTQKRRESSPRPNFLSLAPKAGRRALRDATGFPRVHRAHSGARGSPDEPENKSFPKRLLRLFPLLWMTEEEEEEEEEEETEVEEMDRRSVKSCNEKL